LRYACRANEGQSATWYDVIGGATGTELGTVLSGSLIGDCWDIEDSDGIDGVYFDIQSLWFQKTGGHEPWAGACKLDPELWSGSAKWGVADMWKTSGDNRMWQVQLDDANDRIEMTGSIDGVNVSATAIGTTNDITGDDQWVAFGFDGDSIWVYPEGGTRVAALLDSIYVGTLVNLYWGVGDQGNADAFDGQLDAPYMWRGVEPTVAELNTFFSLDKEWEYLFISDAQGNDSNEGWGRGFAYGKKTLGAATSTRLADGDTIICAADRASGLGFTEELTPIVGTSGKKITYIDSLRFIDGLKVTEPDTSWTAFINGGDVRASCVDASNKDYWDIIGFEFDNATASSFLMSSGCAGVKILQNKFLGVTDSGADNYIKISGAGSENDSVISNLFIGSVQYCIDFGAGSAGPYYIVNNTTYASSGRHLWHMDVGSVGSTFKNNISYNTSSGSDDTAIEVEDVDMVGDWNNNCFKSNAAAQTFFIVRVDTQPVWEDSVQSPTGGNDPDGATATLFTDPSLQAVATSCYITISSACYNTGVVTPYTNQSNPSMGYYQPAAPPSGDYAPGRLPQIIYNYKPKEWYASTRKYNGSDMEFDIDFVAHR
jgi:hypothetical protein